MAIVNRTPDSFYDKGATWDEAAALDRVHEVVAAGADILDVGGVAAAPGAPVDVAEEIRRTVPFVAAVRAAYPDLVISVDTWRHEVATGRLPGRRGPAERHLGRPGSGAARGGRRRSAPGWSARTPASRRRGPGRSGWPTTT